MTPLDTAGLIVRSARHTAECRGDEFWECHWDPGEWAARDPVYVRMRAHRAATGHSEFLMHTTEYVKPDAREVFR